MQHYHSYYSSQWVGSSWGFCGRGEGAGRRWRLWCQWWAWRPVVMVKRMTGRSARSLRSRLKRRVSAPASHSPPRLIQPPDPENRRGTDLFVSINRWVKFSSFWLIFHQSPLFCWPVTHDPVRGRRAWSLSHLDRLQSITRNTLWGNWRKTTQMGRTCKLHSGRFQSGFEPRTFPLIMLSDRHTCGSGSGSDLVSEPLSFLANPV